MKREKQTSKILSKIDSWDEPHRGLGRRIHEIILEAAPDLEPKPFYGAPGYGLGGPVLLFFRVDDGHMSLGVTEKADLGLAGDAKDQLVQSAWFVKGLDEPTERRIAEIARSVAA